MAGFEARRLPQSVTAVLSTPELLESILLRLDLRTLLTSAQLVNRRWHELVIRSPSLQRTLFFQPEDRAQVPSWAPEKNPLLTAAFPAFFNPSGDQIRREVFEKLPMAARLDAFTREEASWRRMLTHKPPAARVGFWKYSHTMGGDYQSFEVEYFPDGLTMGWLYDVVVRWVTQDVSFAQFVMTGRVSGSASLLHDWRTSLQAMEELNGLAEQSDILFKLYMVVQCCPGWLDDFDKFYTRSKPSKRLAE